MPDLNVWLALSWGTHPHSNVTWKWLAAASDCELLFCRLTQIGLLRLLNTKSVMGADCVTIAKAWAVYDRWLQDPKVGFRREPAELEVLFRHATAPFRQMASPKALGDCYLLAMSRATDSTLVTLDGGLANTAAKARQEALLLAP